jgi:hypothetical protein
MNELQIGLNNMHTTFGIYSNCGYNYEEVCQSNNLDSSIYAARVNTYLNLTSLWESMVCAHEKFFECT